jgi:hypothetical protein
MKTFLAPAARVAFVLLGCAAFMFGQTDAEVSATEITQALVKGHIAWKTKLSSPGASARVKEVERKGSLVQYYLYVSGLPVDRLYTYITWPVTQAKPSTVMQGVSLGKDGIAMCAGRTPEQCGDPSAKDDPIGFAFNPAKGEPYRIALVAENYRVAIVIVPDPIMASDKGCTLSVERLLPRFQVAFFSGSGFPANAEVSFDGESYGEKHTVKTTTDSDGNLKFAIMPAVAGHSQGVTSMKAVGLGCSPSVKFEWGS